MEPNPTTIAFQDILERMSKLHMNSSEVDLNGMITQLTNLRFYRDSLGESLMRTGDYRKMAQQNNNWRLQLGEKLTIIRNLIQTCREVLMTSSNSFVEITFLAALDLLLEVEREMRTLAFQLI
ncbi:nonstructural protein 2 [Influenza A virus (A/little yellow-shouldered bat/Guatemala/164/2009(H17N10))]|uniref:Nuclear export protein n=2 Tax=H17N10 subtype TaxID=1129344 RepID=H6QM88_9INFA|nr:nonstructural protein 2 [Influenza A virus (A/little yellow-shouldered bat/Guatemala/153/2009(H17N10))]AFC35434.1 nonstructural protein 2 [Influenza A virus (A/little yellow-shouldered bat/Guatemala/164/2009(H17N10))]